MGKNRHRELLNTGYGVVSKKSSLSVQAAQQIKDLRDYYEQNKKRVLEICKEETSAADFVKKYVESQLEEYSDYNDPDFYDKNLPLLLHYLAQDLADFKTYNSLKKELASVTKLKPKTPYRLARFVVYTCIAQEDFDVIEIPPESFDLIKKAGCVLYDDEGLQGLRDPLLWSFIPKNWHRRIEEAWCGIGSWLA